MWCVIDGHILPVSEARIDPRDRGWSLADGCFETIRVARHQPLWLDWHLERLNYGLEMLGIRLLSPHAVREALTQLAHQMAVNHGIARLQVTRGVHAGRPWPPPIAATPTWLLTLLPAPELPISPNTVRVKIATQTRRNEWSPLSRCKSLASYPDQIIAAREAQAHGFDDALLCNTAGELVCGTVGNLWVVKDSTVITPPLTSGALAGTVRRWLRDTLPSLGVSVKEAPLLPADLAQADECWLTNVGRGIQCVGVVDSQTIGQDQPLALDIYRKLVPILKGEGRG